MGVACFGGSGVVEAVVVHCVGMLSIMGKMRRIGAAKENALAGATGKCWECF